MKKQYFLFLACFIFSSWALVAEDLEEDIFAEGAFDAVVAQGEASEEVNKLVWLGGVSLSSSTTLVIPSEGYGSQGVFTGKGFLKATNPTVASLYLSYSYLHTLWASTDNPVLKSGYGKAAPDPDSPVYKLSEFHISFDVGKLVFIRVGNQLLDWGASAVWSPADFLNRKSADPNAALDTRAGKPGVRLHIPFASGNLFLFADSSRSLTATGIPRDLVKTGSLGFRTDTTFLGWNLGLVGNFGQTSDPRLGATASGALAGFDLWAEAGGVVPLGGHALTWSASLGGERSFGLDSEWTIRGEGFWNPEGQGDVALVPSTLSGFTPFYWGKAYAYAELLKKKLLGPDVTGTLSATANLGDMSWTASAGLRTNFRGLIPFTLYSQYNGGKAEREFTLSTGGPAWTLGLRSFIEL